MTETPNDPRPLTTLAKECADDLEAEIRARYFHDGLIHPANQRRFDLDMGVVNRVRAALASPSAAGGVTGATECQHRFHDRGPRSEAEGENGCPACGEWWARERAAAAPEGSPVPESPSEREAMAEVARRILDGSPDGHEVLIRLTWDQMNIVADAMLAALRTPSQPVGPTREQVAALKVPIPNSGYAPDWLSSVHYNRAISDVLALWDAAPQEEGHDG